MDSDVGVIASIGDSAKPRYPWPGCGNAVDCRKISAQRTGRFYVIKYQHYRVHKVRIGKGVIEINR